MNRHNSKKQKFPNKRLLVLSIGLSAIIVLSLVAYKTLFQTPKFSLKAAIVDQLSEHFPNEAFKNETIKLLKDAGFDVSYFASESVNVTFYTELAKSAYGIIILRTHSALRANETVVDLFTSEPYDKSKYIDYRSNGLLTKGEYLVPFGQTTGDFYFAITPKFIESFGDFPKSIIVAMGCWSLKYYGMAQSFLKKGANAYVGWTDIILSNDTDHETAKFLEMLLDKNETLENSVGITDQHIYHGESETITSRMELYPLSAKDLKLSDLIAEAKSSQTSTGLNNLKWSLFLIAIVSLKSKKSLTI